jgi:hypothetical protein
VPIITGTGGGDVSPQPQVINAFFSAVGSSKTNATPKMTLQLPAIPAFTQLRTKKQAPPHPTQSLNNGNNASLSPLPDITLLPPPSQIHPKPKSKQLPAQFNYKAVSGGGLLIPPFRKKDSNLLSSNEGMLEKKKNLSSEAGKTSEKTGEQQPQQQQETTPAVGAAITTTPGSAVPTVGVKQISFRNVNLSPAGNQLLQMQRFLFFFAFSFFFFFIFFIFIFFFFIVWYIFCG